MTWLDELPEAQRALVVSAPAPRRAAAMKAVLSKKRFSDPKWIFERKLDGIRCIAIRDAGGVRLLSRNDLAMNGRYPEIAAALERQPCERFAIDGEVVAMSHGQTSFSLLAQRGQRAVHVLLYAFDVLWLDGYDVRALPLRVRKRLLRERIDFADPLRWTSHRNERG
ncbi:MAG: bifunctional non-ous end joining protein LigD, partial [Solirubrobacteraceae bacterium]|nr:bifunctional non-ous end joining protein LigD [Solirubrobacteraceae bacterium]